MGKRPALLLVLAALVFACGGADKPQTATAAPQAKQVGYLADGFTEEGILTSGGYGGPAGDDGALTERTCTRVVDGDTIVLDGGERVRYIGMDTPETKHPRKPVQWMGKEASEANRMSPP